MKTFYSHGKLLLTGEYAVLDGALALAIPTKLGQYLRITPKHLKGIHWKSLDADNSVWYEDFLDPITEIFESSRTHTIKENLLSILTAAKKLNPDFLTSAIGWEVSTQLEFSQTWGLGSSSTLINNIAQWAEVDAFQLSNLSLGGSGYDIAAAQNDTPILYQLINNRPNTRNISLDWTFKDKLFFVHLNRKQDSREGIKKYRQVYLDQNFIDIISELTQNIYNSATQSEFDFWVDQHEERISHFIGLPKIKESLFPDYPGSIKSLGAWGGDFIMVSGNDKSQDYFRDKGFHTIISYQDMIL